MPYYAKYLVAVGKEIMEETVEALLDPEITDEYRSTLLGRFNTVLYEIAKDFDKTECEQLYIFEGTVGVFKINI